MIRRNLEFEVRRRLQELIRERGAAAVVRSAEGKNLMAKLEALTTAPQQKEVTKNGGI